MRSEKLLSLMFLVGLGFGCGTKRVVPSTVSQDGALPDVGKPGAGIDARGALPEVGPDTTATSSSDAAADVAAVADASGTTPDLGVADLRPEASQADASPADARTDARDPVDLRTNDTGGADAQPNDAGMPFQPNPACRYLDAQRNVIRCEDWTILATMIPLTRQPMCVQYVSVEPTPGDLRAYRTTPEAAAALGCDLTCVYQGPRASGSLAYCGQGGAFDAYSDGGPGQIRPKGSCKDLFFYSTVAGFGWYESFAEYQKAHPCP